MRYFTDYKGHVIRCHWTADASGSQYGLCGFVDAETGQAVNVDGLRELWTIQDAAAAWKRSIKYVRMIANRVPGAVKIITGPNWIWLIPLGSPNPTGGRPGRKPKK